MSLGSGGSDWLGRMLRAEGSREVEREGKPQYDAPSYDGVSFKSVLIVVLVLVLLFVGAILIFT